VEDPTGIAIEFVPLLTDDELYITLPGSHH
jgi:hypothetical protein